jgi:hypothetical protein
VGLRISFIPRRQSEGDTWTLRVPPGPERGLIPGLDVNGEISGLGAPNFQDLDDRMLERRGGYRRRLLETGVIEVAATGERAKGTVLDWLSDMLAQAR